MTESKLVGDTVCGALRQGSHGRSIHTAAVTALFRCWGMLLLIIYAVEHKNDNSTVNVLYYVCCGCSHNTVMGWLDSKDDLSGSSSIQWVSKH